MFRAGICVIHIWKPTIFVPAFAIRPILIGHGAFSALGVVSDSTERSCYPRAPAVLKGREEERGRREHDDEHNKYPANRKRVCALLHKTGQSPLGSLRHHRHVSRKALALSNMRIVGSGRGRCFGSSGRRRLDGAFFWTGEVIGFDFFLFAARIARSGLVYHFT